MRLERLHPVAIGAVICLFLGFSGGLFVLLRSAWDTGHIVSISVFFGGICITAGMLFCMVRDCLRKTERETTPKSYGFEVIVPAEDEAKSD